MAHYTDGNVVPGPLPFDPLQTDGLFETLLCRDGKVMHMATHLHRLRRSFEQLGRPAPGELRGNSGQAAMERFAALLLHEEGLEHGMARLNLYCPFIHTEQTKCFMLASAFTTSLEKQYSLLPMHLEPVPERLHKSMPRSDFAAALGSAQKRGFDDALLHDGQGYILETSYAALLVRLDGAFVSPAGWKLPSTALAMAREVLPISERPLHLNDLPNCSHAYLLNSLRGMRPVIRIGNLELQADEASCTAVSQLLFGA